MTNELLKASNEDTGTIGFRGFVFMKEIWKDIPNYKGMYQASSLGKIKSLKRNVKHWKGGLKVVHEKVLNQNFDGKGYLQLTLNCDGVQRTFKIHKLIAMTFLGHKPSVLNDLVIDHINNVKTDNRVVNLQVVTHRVNVSKDVKNKTSKYTGVCWNKKASKWIAGISVNKKSKYLGLFNDEYKAHLAYQKALIEIKNNKV